MQGMNHRPIDVKNVFVMGNQQRTIIIALFPSIFVTFYTPGLRHLKHGCIVLISLMWGMRLDVFLRVNLNTTIIFLFVMSVE